MTGPVIALAGASGDLGFRIARALVDRGADVRALVRPNDSPKERARIEGIGATAVAADPADIDEMARALSGAACVVSALNGLGEVMLGRQGLLMEGQAIVP